MPFGKKWFRRSAYLAAASFGGWIVLAACVSPSDRYNDYLDRTSSSRGPIHVSSDAALMEASLPDGGFNGTYLATCLAHVLKVNQSLRFAVNLTYVPNASAAGGNITLTYTPLKASATSITDVVGNPINASSPVDASGNFKVDMQNIVIPGPATPDGTEVHFGTDTFQVGVFTNENSICAGLDGHVYPPPADFDLDHCQDICLFDRIPTPDTALPIYTDKSQFLTCRIPGCP